MKCLSPLRLKRPVLSEHVFLDTPCGKCMACLSNKRSEWQTRLEVELKHATNAWFITLTYDDKNLPFVTKDGIITIGLENTIHSFDEMYPTLLESDVQKFFKRLRKKQAQFTKEQIRYFYVGEYGGQTTRPHYHLLLFNLNNDERVVHLQTLQAWKKGFVYVGKVEPASIAYCTNYIINPEIDVPLGVKPPYARQSRRPAIGHQYINEYKNYHRNDTDNHVYTSPTGVKRNLPRYYKEKIFSKQERAAMRLKLSAAETKKYKYKSVDQIISESKRDHSNQLGFENKVRKKLKNNKL